MSINASRGLDPASIADLEHRFIAAGARSTVVDQGTLDLSLLSRRGVAVEAAPVGAGFPMSVLAADPGAIEPTMGRDVATTLARGGAVFGATSAALRHARVGDSIALSGRNGATVLLEIGAIVPDPVVSGAELVLSLADARRLGLDRPFSVRAWGFTDRPAAETAVRGLQDSWASQPVRVRYSWVDPLLDDTVPQARIKAMLGEFWIVRRQDGSVVVDPAWKSSHIALVSLPIIGAVRCDTTVAAAASAALQEIVDAGLSFLVDGPDSNRNGGCFQPREARALVGNSGGNLSRHTWGAAIDVNPSRNRYGSMSSMDQRVIDAFARHGFVWGGTFLVPDPMHFEYARPLVDAISGGFRP